MDSFQIPEGSVALVTGGASGLGKATTERLAGKGVHVYVADLPVQCKTFGQEDSIGRIHFRDGDVRDEGKIKAIVEEIKSKHNRLDFLINCAGVGKACVLYDFAKDQATPMEEISMPIEVNLIGTLNVIRLAVGLMSKNQPNTEGQRGVIVNVSSCTRRDAWKGCSAYGSSKAAIAALSVPLAKEFAHLGIRVVAIAPGPFETPMVQSMPNFEEKKELISNLHVLPKRLGRPEEFAHTVQYILENPFVNATTIDLDAGMRNPFAFSKS